VIVALDVPVAYLPTGRPDLAVDSAVVSNLYASTAHYMCGTNLKQNRIGKDEITCSRSGNKWEGHKKEVDDDEMPFPSAPFSHA
jgi:hypothetical protein